MAKYEIANELASEQVLELLAGHVNVSGTITMTVDDEFAVAFEEAAALHGIMLVRLVPDE